MSDAHAVARDQLRAFIERIERLEEEKKTIADDIKDVYGEAKGVGFIPAIIREIIKLRKQDKDERAEREALLDTYMAALGMISDPADDDDPRQAAPVQRQPAMALRADGGLRILTKHEDIRTAPVTAEEIRRPAALAVSGGEPSIPSPDAGGEKMDGCSHPGRSDETSAFCNAKSGQATNSNYESDDGAIAEVKGRARLANADRVEPPSSDRPADQPLTGGDHEEVADSRAAKGEGDASAALPAAGVVLEYVPPTGMKRLPFAHCFPELSKAEYERLEQDIAANRVREPIIRQGDVIVDGWARYNISRAYGMSYPVLELHPSRDVLLSIIKWQRAARNFTPAQERKIAAELAKEFPSRADDIMAAFGLAEALEAAE